MLAAVMLGGAVGLGVCFDRGLAVVLVVFALGGLTILITRPRALVVVACLVTVFSQTLTTLAPEAGTYHLDEVPTLVAIVVLPLARMVRGSALRFPVGGLAFLAFGLAGVASSIASSVPATVALQGAYPPFRAVAFGWAVSQLDWRPPDLRMLANVGRIFVASLLAVTLFGLAVPRVWVQLGVAPDSNFAGYVFGVSGPFRHPSFFGQLMALASVALFAELKVFGRGHRLLLLLTGVGALSSFRRKTFVSLPVGLFTVAVRKNAVTAVAAMIGVAILLVATAGPALVTVASQTKRAYFTDPQEAPRTAITLGAAQIATADFPFGAGFGRFGSETASQDYSPEYVKRGFDEIDGLKPGDTRYGADTFWPVLAGESGWLGLIFYSIGLVSIFRRFAQGSRSTDKLAAVLGLTGMGWMSVLLVESSAAPVFLGPPTYPVVFGLVGLLVSYRDCVERDMAAVSPSSESTITYSTIGISR